MPSSFYTGSDLQKELEVSLKGQSEAAPSSSSSAAPAAAPPKKKFFTKSRSMFKSKASDPSSSSASSSSTSAASGAAKKYKSLYKHNWNNRADGDDEEDEFKREVLNRAVFGKRGS